MNLDEIITQINRKLNGIKDKKHIVVWGAAENTVRLFQYTDISLYPIEAFVDNTKAGEQFFGKTVQAPQDIIWKDVEAVVVSSFYHEDDIEEELNKKCGFAGTVIKLNEVGQKVPFYMHMTVDNEKRQELAKSRDIEEVRKCLNIQKILGDVYKVKIKVRIAHSMPHFWNSIQTMVESFCERTDMDVKVILSSLTSNDLEKMLLQMEEGHYKYVHIEDYDVENDKPDIAIFSIAHSDIVFKMWGGVDKIRQNVKYISVVPYDNSVKFEQPSRMNNYYHLMEELNADIFIVAKPIYDVIKDKYANTIQMNSPKFDAIYRKMNCKNDILETWKKLEGKKVIVWTTIHGHDEWEAGKFFVGVSFDVYIKDILNYFKTHRNLGLIFRPHPEYIKELVYLHKIWTEEDLQYMKDYFAQSENMIWDDSTDYSNAFSISDALITDDGTGITLSYLPTRKPICILRRNSIEVYTGTLSVTKNYYVAHDFSELRSYFEMVAKGEDPLYEKRMCTVEEFIPVFDGKNGMRIADRIIADFQEKFMKDN